MLIFNIKYYNTLKENVQINLKLESILYITDLFYLFIDIFISIWFIKRFYRFLNKNDLWFVSTSIILNKLEI